MICYFGNSFCRHNHSIASRNCFFMIMILKQGNPYIINNFYQLIPNLKNPIYMGVD